MHYRASRPLYTSIVALVSAAALLSMPGHAEADCPMQPPVTISPQVPPDVCIPTGFGGLPIKFFDDYSWRAFVAMVWPADINHRGQADSSKQVGDLSAPLVFQTFKSEWELFADTSDIPSPWEVFGPRNPCNLGNIGIRDLVLGTFSFSKFGNLGEAGQPPKPLVGTLVAQNRTYVRYSTGFNKIEYDQILREKLYLKTNQQNVVFENGAIDVKASWMDMTGIDQPEKRYYTRDAWLFDPASQTCVKTKVGLLGLHIVQKTDSRPQWIWSTFEHIDNVPPSHGRPMALNDASGTPMGKTFPDANKWPPKFPVPPAYNVERLKSNDINGSTKGTNTNYQQALQGTIWQNYQLVMTQWPVPDPPTAPKVDPKQPGKPGFTFPGSGANSAFANTTLETFDQGNVNTGCMNCHNVTKDATDFVWSLAVNGLTNAPPSPTALSLSIAKTTILAGKPVPARWSDQLSPELQALMALMQSTQESGSQK